MVAMFKDMTPHKEAIVGIVLSGVAFGFSIAAIVLALIGGH